MNIFILSFLLPDHHGKNVCCLSHVILINNVYLNCTHRFGLLFAVIRVILKKYWKESKVSLELKGKKPPSHTEYVSTNQFDSGAFVTETMYFIF